ncbi:MAG: vitamin K epoxide reductase family protein [Fibrella sp.]|nr:vitamin K epoxide reductase family protein [Armatimonadota bacterium]
MPATIPIANRLIFVLSVIGAFVAGYLWYLHATHADIPCGMSSGCEMVAASKYARFPEGTSGPWYVAAWGTIGYLGFAILSFLRTLQTSPERDRILLGLLILGAVAGTVFSLRLTYLEIYVIHAICKWCITSQVIIFAIAAISFSEWLGGRHSLLASSTEN